MRRMSGFLLASGGIAAGIAMATWLARPRRRIPPSNLAPASEFVWAGGVRTHVVTHGAEGPTVVLLHGMRGWFLTWRHIVPELSARARVMLIDLKGFGLSTLPASGEYNADGLAEHVLATLDALKLEAPILGGLSLGGEVALRLALRAPQRVGGLARQFRKDLPHAEFHEVHDAGHVSVEEQPAAVAHLIVDWLSRRFQGQGGAAG